MQTPSSSAPPPSSATSLRALAVYRAVTIGALALAVVIAVAVPLARGRPPGDGPGWFFFVKQDLVVVPLLFAALLARPQPIAGDFAVPAGLMRPWSPVLLALLLALVCLAGHWLVFDAFDLTRDEQMANFDAFVFAHGRLAWPIAPDWRPFAAALNQIFILPVADHAAWVSSYLPGNAALRALFGSVGAAALVGPLLVAIGALALWSIGGRLWPDRPASRLVALVLYAGSSQVVLTGMTAYAMSAHLGLDLLWLALFLRGGTAATAMAIAIGALATGLHQPLFHPLFVLPFLDLLRQQRRWRLLAVYLVAYGLIGAFWLAWPRLVVASVGAPAPGEDAGYLARITSILHGVDIETVWLMTVNLIRFAAWQHLLLLPLLGPGLLAARRDPMARALAIGFVLPIVAVTIILPQQGHGWGYRYVHGVLGNVCLLGGYGWSWLAARGLGFRRALAWTSAATFAILLPMHAVLAHRWVDAYATSARAIEASGADLAVVADAGLPWALDLVVNAPDLGNRPIRLMASQLRAGDMAALCRHGSVAFIDYPRLAAIAAFFDRPVPGTGPHFAALETAARQAGCVIVAP